MKDDAAKILIYILASAFLMGLLVLGGHYLITGKAYTQEFCLESNRASGFYPYNPPETIERNAPLGGVRSGNVPVRSGNVPVRSGNVLGHADKNNAGSDRGARPSRSSDSEAN